jgi:hypothetical protein
MPPCISCQAEKHVVRSMRGAELAGASRRLQGGRKLDQPTSVRTREVVVTCGPRIVTGNDAALLTRECERKRAIGSREPALRSLPSQDQMIAKAQKRIAASNTYRFMGDAPVCANRTSP